MRTIAWFIKFIAYFFKVRKLENQYLEKFDNGTFTEEDRKEVDKLVQDWAGMMLSWAGVKVEVTGAENFPMDRPALITPNHQGNFDIPVVLACLPRLCAVVSKKEVEKIPFIAGWMKLFNCILLDRGNARAALASMKQVEKLLGDGIPVIIFPEGTRSKSSNMNEFKHGAIKPATNSGVPIVPVAIEGTYKIMEANGGFMKPGNVKIHILPPIETKGLSKEETKELSKIVSEKIKEAKKILQ